MDKEQSHIESPKGAANNNLVSTSEVYLTIASFDQYVDSDEDGNEVHQKTYKMHITNKEGEEWVHTTFSDHKTIAALKAKVEAVGTINLDHWAKLARWERLKLIEYTEPLQPYR